MSSELTPEELAEGRRLCEAFNYQSSLSWFWEHRRKLFAAVLRAADAETIKRQAVRGGVSK